MDVEVGRRVVDRVTQGAPALGGGIGTYGRVLRRGGARSVDPRRNHRTGANRTGAPQKRPAVDAHGGLRPIRGIAHPRLLRPFTAVSLAAFEASGRSQNSAKKSITRPAGGAGPVIGGLSAGIDAGGAGRPSHLPSARPYRAPRR